jgi:hypothetical protein
MWIVGYWINLEFLTYQLVIKFQLGMWLNFLTTLGAKYPPIGQTLTEQVYAK